GRFDHDCEFTRPSRRIVCGRGWSSADVRERFPLVAPSVVQITTSEGLGSGIVYDRAGDIVTNNHVVGTATSFTVTTWSGKQLQRKLVGAFAPDDLAVIKVAGSGLRPAVFADSSRLRIGGYRDGDREPARFEFECDRGIISSLNRQES